MTKKLTVFVVMIICVIGAYKGIATYIYIGRAYKAPNVSNTQVLNDVTKEIDTNNSTNINSKAETINKLHIIENSLEENKNSTYKKEVVKIQELINKINQNKVNLNEVSRLLKGINLSNLDNKKIEELLEV